MPGKKEPGKLVAGDGAKAFSSSQSPSGGSKAPRVDTGVGSNSGGLRPNSADKPVSGRRVPDWKK